MADKFIDFTNGNNSNNGTSFALRVKDMVNGATAGRTTAGDRWKIMKSEDPVSLGINATFTNKSDTVTLASSLTANIDTCEAAWTAVSANVTQSNPTTRKEGSKSIQFNVAAAFTTGQMAYLTIASTDFSAYNKVSFWIKPTIQIASGALKLVLCSDTVGTVAVNTITINEVINSGSWRCVTVDTGGALGAAIQSISFNAITDPGTVNIQLDNILACNNLTLTSLISTNSTATGYGTMNWYPVKSINGTTVKIDNGTNLDAATTGRGVDIATVTATCYKIEPIRIPNAVQPTNLAGTNDTTRVTFSGGWDTSAMTSQTGLTFLDGGDSTNNIIQSSQSFISFDHIVVVRGNNGMAISSAANNNVDNCAAIDNNTGGINSSGNYSKITNCENYNSNATPFQVSGALSYVDTVKSHNSISSGASLGGAFSMFLNCTTINNGTTGIAIGTSPTQTRFYNVVSKDNGTFGFSNATSSNTNVYGITTSGNTSGGISAGGAVFVDNPNCTDSTPFTNTGLLQISRISGDPAQAKIYHGGSGALCIQIDTTTVHGSATKSYEHSPQSIHLNQYLPLVQKLQPFVVANEGIVTFSIWVQRSNSSNVAAQILVRGGQSNGVSSDITAAAAAASNTWEQLSVSFSPTQGVPIVIELQSWRTAGAGNIFFSDSKLQRSVYSESANKLIRCDSLDFNLFAEPFVDNVNPKKDMSLRSSLGRTIRA